MRGDLAVRNKNEILFINFICFLFNQTALNPIPLYQQGGGEEKAEIARLVNRNYFRKKKIILLITNFQSAFAGALAVGDLVKSTLGPKGMVK